VVRNVAALVLTAGAARLFDAGYRLAVARLVGAETVGLLQMAWPVYGFAFTLATLSLAPAIARVVAAGPREGRSVVVTGRTLALPTGLVSAALLFLAAPFLARHALADPRVLAPLRVMAFGLLPTALSSVLRGWFQGAQRMAPLAWAQLVEPMVRLGVALLVLLALPALWSVPLPLPPAALLATAGVAGETVECLFLTGWNRREARREARRTALGGRRPAPSGFSLPLAARLLAVGGPLMAGQFVFSAVSVLQAGLFPRLLVLSGLSAPAATREYGMLYGMTLPFLLFPMTLLFPLSAILVPAVAEARAAGKPALLRRRVTLAVWGALVVAAAAALLYLALPDRLAALVGGEPTVTVLIRGLALWAPFAYLEHVSGAALIGLGATGGFLGDGLAGQAVTLGLAWWLAPCPALRTRGLLLALAAGDAVAAAAHFARLARAQDLRRPRDPAP
jgi:stage V sporulation protein B